VARYVQIGGQLVPLNAAGQIIGLSESPLNAQGTVNTLEQSGAGVSGAYEPIINYLQSDNPDSMEPSAARSNGDVNDDAMGLVAQAMSGGEHGSDSGEYDGASWNKVGLGDGESQTRDGYDGVELYFRLGHDVNGSVSDC